MTVNIEALRKFVSTSMEVSIQDDESEDKAPFVKKVINKLEICPDKTHLRIYFDHQRFFAVPLTATDMMDEGTWTAFDSNSNLKYIIRKVRKA